MGEAWRKHLPGRSKRKVPPHGHPRLRRRLDTLEAEVRRLHAELDRADRRLLDRVVIIEDGLQEERSLSPRVAELADLVTVLVAAAVRGEDEFRRVLEQAAADLDPRG